MAQRGRPRKNAQSEGKRVRVPFGGNRQKLQLSEAESKALDKSGYVPRWVNDKDGRIQRAEAGGWIFMKPEEALSVGGGESHKEGSDLHGKVSLVVSMGVEKPIRAFLMKIKKKYYDEDQLLKEQQNALIDSALNTVEQGGQTIESGYTPT